MIKKLKFAGLSKLRQFSQGMDVEKYLTGEFRQILRSLEDGGVDLTDIQNSINSVASKSAGFYAVNVNTISSTQNIPFTSYFDVDSSGAVTTLGAGNLWTPNKNGKYWFEASAQFNELLAGSGTQTATLSAYLQDGTLVASTVASYQMSGVYYFGGKKPGICAGIADLTTTNGLYFKITLANHTVQNLSFKIIRIGD